ncbi:inactive serine protease 35-like [Cololabis saira]|uniref:inactive serine protease 35-like n=1 Tax=Cololabis saira TaxID=129043 RepID=UPI002AD27F64|nr:inactive serine protease 35-like [Cololabis saira]
MTFKRFMFVLLCAAALTVSVVCGKNESSNTDKWTRQSLPGLLVTHTAPLPPTLFRGHEESETEVREKKLCGIECQSTLPLMDQAEQERFLGYETVYENGTRVHTDVSLQWMNKTFAGKPPVSTRRKRQVYGADGRFVITDLRYITTYPFSATVRLSTSCSGVLVSPKHVLTAARCVHDGKDYLESGKRLRVGLLQLKPKRRLGRRRGGRQRGGKKQEAEKKGEEELTMEGEEKNSLGKKKRRGSEGRKHGGRKRGWDGESDGANKNFKRRERGKQKDISRVRRSLGPGKQPVFRWTRVKRTHIPQGWILANHTANSVSSDYDYALLELKRPVKQKHMDLGVAPHATPLSRIHFSGFDSDKSLLDGSGDEKVIYRFCSVAKESNDLMYQHCDAQRGATGAGIYIRLRQDGAYKGDKGKWERRVIGVFSGHQWVLMEGGEQRDFNVAVRITPPKYAQICQWIHGDLSLCKEI